MSTKLSEDFESQDQSYSQIGFRLYLLIQNKTEEKNRYANLEKLTNVSRDNWRQWWNKWRESVPSGNLIQAAACLWPHHAFWLATGIMDASNGHTLVQNTQSKSFPDSKKNINREIEALSKAYFDLKREIVNDSYTPSEKNGLKSSYKPTELLHIKIESLKSINFERQKKITVNFLCEEIYRQMNNQLSDEDGRKRALEIKTEVEQTFNVAMDNLSKWLLLKTRDHLYESEAFLFKKKSFLSE